MDHCKQYFVKSEDKDENNNKEHCSFFSIHILIPAFFLAVCGAIIGVQLIATLGIAVNTSIIGALLAIMMSRIPFSIFARFKSLERQNLLQTVISSASYGAGNALMIPIGVPFVMGMPELVLPLLLGVSIAAVIDIAMMYNLFNSRPFPATGKWPGGAATATALWAGDQGGKKGLLLVLGMGAGAGGSAFFGLPMAAAGLSLLGNPWALAMFGVGLLIRAYGQEVSGLEIFSFLFPNGPIDVMTLYLPHGLMIGAGVVSLFQLAAQARVRRRTEGPAPEELTDRSPTCLRRVLSRGFLAFTGAALLLSLFTGLYTHMSGPHLAIFLLYAAFAASLNELIIGTSSMHAGWFPAMALGLIHLIIGILIGFPPVALAVLVGFCTAVGPSFSDLGCDFKTGFLLRGSNRNRAYETAGRRQQYYAALLGFAVAACVVAIFHPHFFSQGTIPPVDRVYASTIKAGVSPDIALKLALWAIPGALFQYVGGSRRQFGVLLGTGLLIVSPLTGWVVAATLLVRAGLEKLWGESKRAEINAFAGGLVAGSALYTFVESVHRSAFATPK